MAISCFIGLKRYNIDKLYIAHIHMEGIGMELSLYSRRTNRYYFMLPICANYTFISRNTDYTNPHALPFYNFVVVVERDGTMLDDGRLYPLRERDIVILQPNKLHTYASESDPGMTFFTVNFCLIPQDEYMEMEVNPNWYIEEDFSEPYMVAETAPLGNLFDIKMTDIYVHYDSMHWEQIIHIISEFSKSSLQYYDNIFKKWLNDSPDTTCRFCNDSTTLLWGLFSLFSRKGHADTLAREENVLLTRITGYLEENVCEKYSLKKMAQYLNYNPNYLCTFFVSRTGMTLGEYFNQLKITRACRYLRDTDKPISEIATTLGFSSPNHFSCNFSAIKKMPPKQYRRQLY